MNSPKRDYPGDLVTAATSTPPRNGPAATAGSRRSPARPCLPTGYLSCFGYVQTYDTKPKRRLFEVLKSQGMRANQQVTFLTDGGEDIRDLPATCYLLPQPAGRARARLV